MKKLACFIVFLAFALVSCKKEPVPQPEPQLPVNFTNTAGEWVLQSWKGEDMADAGIYLSLRDKEFVLWQSVGSMYPVKYTGSYNIYEEEGTGMIIRGIYDYTYEYWNNRYIITSLTENSMEWTSVDDRSDVYLYIKTTNFPK